MNHLGFSELPRTSSDESVTGFVPRDTYTPAPTTIPSAREAFTPPQISGEAVIVDPLGNLTAREVQEHRERVAGIMLAQEAAVQELGIDTRRVA
jgi:hypothetical protein